MKANGFMTRKMEKECISGMIKASSTSVNGWRTSQKDTGNTFGQLMELGKVLNDKYVISIGEDGWQARGMDGVLSSMPMDPSIQDSGQII